MTDTSPNPTSSEELHLFCNRRRNDVGRRMGWIPHFYVRIFSIVFTIIFHIPYDVLTSLFDERVVDILLEAALYMILVGIFVLVCWAGFMDWKKNRGRRRHFYRKSIYRRSRAR